ncbi:hypothetical protein DPMN_077700 [Dreissena polymorpha]|uniref:Uncharacterized protein n=1 Tax=Dreissena polymorpha TaxID=45954 RepID=A0A9D3YKY8_DREPO|nr:hypothetical protein DPMN_077700 [Dreissena polymorpha]
MKEAKWEWIERQFINIDKKDYHRMHDADRNLLTASAAALNNWTEYCSDLFNYALRTDRSLKRKLKPVHAKEEVDDAKISGSNDCSYENAMPNTLVEQNINCRTNASFSTNSSNFRNCRTRVALWPMVSSERIQHSRSADAQMIQDLSGNASSDVLLKLTERWVTSLRHQWASVGDVGLTPSCQTFSLRRLCKRPPRPPKKNQFPSLDDR